MQPDVTASLVEFVKRLWPEFTGGFAAFWTHHLFSKIWHASERLPSVLRRRR